MSSYTLKNYKERRSERNWGKLKDIATILSVPTVIVTVIISFILLKYHLELLIVILTIILNLLFLGIIVFYHRKRIFGKLKNKEFFSTGFDFRQPDNETIENAINGIFSFTKSQPYFIHVTSPNEEIKEIFNAFVENGNNFIHIHGKPGEGKSMLAFHAIYQIERNYIIRDIITCTYSLKLDILADRNKDVIKDILNELDCLSTDYNEPALKLILIDDAHRLPFSYELEQALREEASQSNGKFIWITTDLDPFDKMSKKRGDLNINFQSYYLQIVSTLYQSKDKRIQSEMIDKFPKLEKAKSEAEAGKINNPWTFNFVASDGFEKLKEDILKLTDEEKYILYLLSAFNTIVGEGPLRDTEFYVICIKNKPTWFQLLFSDFQKTLSQLSEQKPENIMKEKRRMMLRLNRDVKNNVWVESLHALFATSYLKEVSIAFENQLRLEMMKGLNALLDDNWKNFRYLNSFLVSIGNNADLFLEQNKDWIKRYFNNLEQNHLHQYCLVIKQLLKFNEPLFTNIFTDDYFQRNSFFFNQLPIYRLQAFANLIRTLPPKLKIKLIEKLDVSKLSDTISNATIENLNQGADLINAFDNHKEKLLNELIKEKKLDNIIEQISNAHIENLKQAADLINAFDNHKEELLNGLIKNKKLDNIIEQISKVTNENLIQAADLINAFDNHKEEITLRINFNFLNKQINEWQQPALISTWRLVTALSQMASKLLFPFSHEKFILLSYQIKGNNIRALTSIFGKLPHAIQTLLLDKFPWVDLLNKSSRTHFFYLNNITRIMNFGLQSQKHKEKFKETLREYIALHREDFIKMIYTTRSTNYRALYNSILILSQISEIEIATILKDSINGFCKHFEIFPSIASYISRLLYLFYSIDPDIAYKIFLHKKENEESVNQQLKKFLSSEVINENPDGTKGLIKAIRNSNRRIWDYEFMTDKKIIHNLSNYNLHELYEEQNNDRNRINITGLTFFSLDNNEEQEYIDENEIGK